MPKKPNILRTATTLPFGLLIAACSSDVVDLGGGSPELEGTVPAACAGTSPNGNVTVGDQAGLEALRGCEELRNLTIIFSEPDLRPLSSLRWVKGVFQIVGSVTDVDSGLTRVGGFDSLKGLESLERVGSLWLSELRAPTLEPLRNLSEVGGNEAGTLAGEIHIDHAFNLRNLAGLENAVGFRRLALYNNPELESLEGLQAPSHVDSIHLEGNPKLQDIEALSPVSDIQHHWVIKSTGIEHLHGSRELQWLGALEIINNLALVDITGFDRLHTPGDIRIQGNPQLRRVPEFSEVKFLDSLVVTGNSELQVLPAFVDFQDGTMTLLEIADNASLPQFAAPALLRAASSVTIQDNPSLREVDLGELETVTFLTIANNPILVSVGIGRLQTVNSLELLDNGLLPTAAFDELQTFTRNIQGNAGDAAP